MQWDRVRAADAFLERLRGAFAGSAQRRLIEVGALGVKGIVCKAHPSRGLVLAYAVTIAARVVGGVVQ